MKTSKIKSVTPNGTFDSKHGLLYKFEYEMEDGTSLTANHKDPFNVFGIGQEVEYEIKGTNDYGSWGSVKKPESDYRAFTTTQADQDTRQRSIVRQSCLNRAVDYSSQGMNPMSKEEITDLAEYFENWVNR